MARLTKDEGMAPNKNSINWEIIYGTAYRADARSKRIAIRS